MNRFIFLLTIVFLISCSSENKIQEIETYTVERAEFVSAVTETGELKAVNSMNIPAPRISWRFGQLKVTFLVEDGTEVKENDTLAEFDKSEVQKAMEDAQAELDIAQAELRKAEATQASQIEDLEADLERSKIQHRISELNLESATYESDIRRKEIELELKQSSISLEKAKSEIENQKKVNQEELNKLELRVQQAKSKLREAQETLDKLTIKAPNPGIAIIERNWATGNKIQVDDQVWPGWHLISLPDLSEMKAEVMVNEVDIAKIDTGQTCRIRMDAYPDTFFTGKVTEIARLAHNEDDDSKVKVFDVSTVLDDTHEKLMPGMTVSCEIIVNRVADTLFVPLESVFKKAQKDIVFVKQGNDFNSRNVTLGEENENYVLVLEGLKEGEHVALMDPTLTEEKKSENGEASL